MLHLIYTIFKDMTETLSQIGGIAEELSKIVTKLTSEEFKKYAFDLILKLVPENKDLSCSECKVRESCYIADKPYFHEAGESMIVLDQIVGRFPELFNKEDHITYLKLLMKRLGEESELEFMYKLSASQTIFTTSILSHLSRGVANPLH